MVERFMPCQLASGVQIDLTASVAFRYLSESTESGIGDNFRTFSKCKLLRLRMKRRRDVADQARDKCSDIFFLISQTHIAGAFNTELGFGNSLRIQSCPPPPQLNIIYGRIILFMLNGAFLAANAT